MIQQRFPTNIPRSRLVISDNTTQKYDLELEMTITPPSGAPMNGTVQHNTPQSSAELNCVCCHTSSFPTRLQDAKHTQNLTMRVRHTEIYEHHLYTPLYPSAWISSLTPPYGTRRASQKRRRETMKQYSDRVFRVMTSCYFLRSVLVMEAEVGGGGVLQHFGVVTQSGHLRVCWFL